MGTQNSSKENEFLNIENKNHFLNSLITLDIEEKRVKQLHDYSYFKDNISYNGISSNVTSPNQADSTKPNTFLFKIDKEDLLAEKAKQQTTNQESNTVTTIFEWREGGETVYLTGSFVNWEQKILLKRNYVENKFEVCLNIPRGKYEYKFVVDNIWKFSKYHPTAKDQRGIVNNVIDNRTGDNDCNSNTKADSNNTQAIKQNVPQEEMKQKEEVQILEKSNRKLFKEKEKEEFDIKALNECQYKQSKDSPSSLQDYIQSISLDYKGINNKSLKDKEDYLNSLPSKIELNTDAIFCPDPYKDLYNINISSRQTRLGDCEHLEFTHAVYGVGNTSFLSISTPPHVNLNHISTKMINNKKDVIVTSSTSRTNEKILTMIYYSPVYLSKRRKM